MSRALVTGGAGLVGSHIVDLLLAKGWEVRVLDNLHPGTHPNGKPSWISEDVEFLLADVADYEPVQMAVMDCDLVFHQAAYGGFVPNAGLVMTKANALGTVNVATASVYAGVKKMIMASSQAVYGHTGEDGKPLREDGPTDLPTMYALSKFYAEQAALMIGAERGLPVVALRYALTYGPRQSVSNRYTGICSIFATRLLLGEAPLIYEDGRQTRDFTYVEDVAAANLLVAEDDRADGRVFNVGTGQPTTVLDFARMLRDKLGGPAPEVLWKKRPGDARHVICDATQLRGLGWEPKVGVVEGVSRYCDWFLNER